MKRLTLLLSAMVYCQAADQTYPTPIGVSDTILITGVAPTVAPANGQVKIGGGRVASTVSFDAYLGGVHQANFSADAQGAFVQWRQAGKSFIIWDDVNVPQVKVTASAPTSVVANTVAIGGGAVRAAGPIDCSALRAGEVNGATMRHIVLGYNALGSGTYAIQAVHETVGYTALSLNELGGNIGIGTADPSQRLHVNGTSRLGNYIYAGSGPSAGGFIGSNIYYNGTNYSKVYSGVNAGGWKIGNSNGGTGDIHFQTSNWGADATNLTDATFPTRMSIAANGEVIVYGTVPAPAGSIDGQIRMGGGRVMVGGTLSAKEIKVTTTGADYVFEDGYKLRSLAEVEQFIAKEKHLPEMMPAKEMQANGMPVSEVVTKQLAKIEELTLYAIQAKKERDAAYAQDLRTQERLAVVEKQLASVVATNDQLVDALRLLLPNRTPTDSRQ